MSNTTLTTEQKSAALIMPNETEAKTMADFLAEQTGVKHIVYTLPQGYQIVPVKVLEAYMPPAKPLPVSKNSLFANAAAKASPLPLKATAEPTKAKEGDKDKTVTLTFPMIRIAKVYIDVKMPDGTLKSISKNSIIDYEIHSSDQTVVIVCTKAFAKKRGFI